MFPIYFLARTPTAATISAIKPSCGKKFIVKYILKVYTYSHNHIRGVGNCIFRICTLSFAKTATGNGRIRIESGHLFRAGNPLFQQIANVSSGR